MRNELVTFSIIIRNFNYARYVGDAVDSALAQEHARVQVIVIDDGSTDESIRVLRSYGAQIHLIERENGGESAAANDGFAAAGDWVIFLDSDDVLAPDGVATVAGHITSSTARIHWRMLLLDERGSITGHLLPPGQVPNYSFEESLLRFGAVVSVGQSFNAYRREVLRKIMPADTSLWFRAIDTYMNAVTSAHGETKYIDDILGGYRRHSCSQSLQNTVEVASAHHAMLIHPNLERCLRQVLDEGQTDFRYSYPRYHWYHRLASLRLAPERHPFPQDSRTDLVARIRNANPGPFGAGLHFRFRVWCGIQALAYLPRPILRRIYPTLAQFARRLSLTRGGKRAFKAAGTGFRVGANWRTAFQVPHFGSGRPCIPGGGSTPERESKVGAMSRT